MDRLSWLYQATFLFTDFAVRSQENHKIFTSQPNFKIAFSVRKAWIVSAILSLPSINSNSNLQEQGDTVFVYGFPIPRSRLMVAFGRNIYFIYIYGGESRCGKSLRGQSKLWECKLWQKWTGRKWYGAIVLRGESRRGKRFWGQRPMNLY